jgi:predicted O-methyltransferase YrrM
MFTDGIERVIEPDAAYWLKKTASVDGWLTEAEGQALYYLAYTLPKHSNIVELGSYMGKSSIMLAGGLEDSERKNTKLYCIDLFKIAANDTELNTYASGDIRLKFLKNIRYAGIDKRIEAIVSDTKSASAVWTKSIELLFIDADHTYDGVKADYENWEPFLNVGCYIAFHDANGSWESVTKLVNEVMSSGKFEHITSVDSLVYARKIK